LDFIPQFLTVTYFSKFDKISIIFGLISLFVSVLLFGSLIFKTDYIIKILRLDKGFDNDKMLFEKLESEQVIKLAIIIIGAFLVIKNISEILIYMVYAFQVNIDGKINTGYNTINWVISSAKVVIGFLLLTNYKWASKILNKNN